MRERSGMSSEPRGDVQLTRLVAVEGFTFTGSYEDPAGIEHVVWCVEPSDGRGFPGYDLRTEIRGVAIWGYDFDGLEPVSVAAAQAAGIQLNRADELASCILTGDLPCKIDDGTDMIDGVVTFTLTLRGAADTANPNPRNLRLTTVVDGKQYEVIDDLFEDGVLRLDECLPPTASIRCCVTCLLSDYSPGGHGLMGMSCHRDAKEQYLAVKSKADYWSVPTTETVMETYLCPEYERRIPGTGYRG